MKRTTDISGNYADMARAFGGYDERVTEPAEIVPVIRRGIEKTQAGTPPCCSSSSRPRRLSSRFIEGLAE